MSKYDSFLWSWLDFFLAIKRLSPKRDHSPTVGNNVKIDD